MVGVLDVSGYSFSGKSAIIDYLNDNQSFYVFPREFEFDLLRIRGGIYELSINLTDKNWSPIRSSETIRDFYNIINNVGKKRNLFTRINSIGSYYCELFPGFKEKSLSYLEDLIQVQYEAYWPFPEITSRGNNFFLKKIFRKIGYNYKNTIYLSRISKNKFNNFTKEYFENLFEFIDKKNFNYVVLNNAFETSNPEKFFSFFKNPRSIIVDRDPRDIYLSALSSGMVDNINVGATLLGNNVFDFIKRYKLFRKAYNQPVQNVLRISFDSFINEHIKTLQDIENFLDVELKPKTNDNSHFNLLSSKKNIKKWLLPEFHIYHKDIELIEKELKEFLFYK